MSDFTTQILKHVLAFGILLVIGLAALWLASTFIFVILVNI